LISDIGTQPNNRSDPGSTLVCDTRNVNNRTCCRSRDNHGNESLGVWYYNLDNARIQKPSESKRNNNIFVRVGYAQQVRLSTKSMVSGPVGEYRCDVPDGTTGANVSAIINIVTGW